MTRTPQSTYRLQLHAEFTFKNAMDVAQYIHDLGVTHVYSSPYLQAGKGSMHGYDVVDHHQVNQELGGTEWHERFCQRLGEIGLGQVLDIVPNHMAAQRENRMWWDVLENGPSSRFASFFDIDWNSAEEKLRDKVLVPVLGDQYGRVLSRGELQIRREDTNFLVTYFDNAFPIAPRSLPPVLARAAQLCGSDLLAFVADSLARLPAPESTDRSVQISRHRDKMVLYQLLKRLCSEHHDVCKSIDGAMSEWNGNPDAMDDLLNNQNYRLAFWRTSNQELGYRRFFDVNTLIGLRMERQYVFDETHDLILDWLDKGVLDGVRIDHPDGLRDPKQYLERLRQRAPDAWIVAEKILEPGEWLRTDWPIQGTTGYDFLTQCNGLLVSPDGLRELTAIYEEFTGAQTGFRDLAYEKKARIAQESLAADVNRLASIFVEICERNRDSRDYSRAEIRRAIRAVAACFEVYRTYVVPERNEITEWDVQQIHDAVEEAKRRRPELDAALFDLLESVLTLKTTGRLESEFVARFQQFTAPVMAKGVEDTAFYDYDRLTSLNEVGGNPGTDGLSLEEFHRYNAYMQEHFPLTMLSLSTHDTKRADDVRARIAVLSEVPDRWQARLKRWSRMNEKYRTGNYPDTNTEYFLYQTLVGAWPISEERTQQYMQKAMREAKLETSWTATNQEFEDALHNFINCILKDDAFTADMKDFVDRIRMAGRINSLSQVLLRATSPGVPDHYQGSELWDDSLVDPDNRRPVDYVCRQELLNRLRQSSPADALNHFAEHFEDGSPKMWVIYQALRLRHERPQSFGEDSGYTPMYADGARSEHVIAYRRADDVIAVAQRFSHRLGGTWADTSLSLPAGMWRNWLTGEAVGGDRAAPVAELLGLFPVGLLVREQNQSS